jgi:hypothetical protein
MTDDNDAKALNPELERKLLLIIDRELKNRGIRDSETSDLIAEHKIRKTVDEEIKTRLKDEVTVEIQIAERVWARVSKWVKASVVVVGIPVVVVIGLAAFFGVKEADDLHELSKDAQKNIVLELKDFARLHEEFKQDLASTEKEMQQARQFAQEIGDIRTRLGMVETSVNIGINAPNILSDTFLSLLAYLKSIGYDTAPVPIQVEVVAQTIAVRYDTSRQRLQIPATAVGSLDIAMSQFAAIALRESNSELATLSQEAGAAAEDVRKHAEFFALFALSQGLSSYLTCSFKQQDIFNNTLRLSERREFADVGQASQNGQWEAWASAFWLLRSKLGAEASDRLVFEAWKLLSLNDVGGGLEQVFLKKIVAADKSLFSEKHLNVITDVFKGRGLSL